MLDRSKDLQVCRVSAGLTYLADLNAVLVQRCEGLPDPRREGPDKIYSPYQGRMPKGQRYELERQPPPAES